MKITQQFYRDAQPLNRPENLKLAKEIVREFGIERDIPREERIAGESVFHTTWLLKRKVRDCSYSLYVKLNLKNVLTITANQFYSTGVFFHGEKELVKISLDKLNYL